MNKRVIRYHSENFDLIQKATGLRINRAHHFYYIRQLSIEMNNFVDSVNNILNQKR